MGALPNPPHCAAFRRKQGTGPYVVAEIGVNHEGNLDLAKRLIDEAVRGGADCVKFQTYKASKLASKNSPSYWDLKSEPTTSQHELFSRFDKFGDSDYQALAVYAKSRGVDFASTPFDLDAVELLAPLMPFFKIASADLTNTPLLDACAAHRKPILLSTGAAHLSEIEEAVRRLRKTHAPEEICVMHCVLNYPTPYPNAHLAAIRHLRNTFFEHPIGYSDHTRPDAAMLVLLRAYELGAVVLEKHFTHDKSLQGNDHYHAMNEADVQVFRKNIDLLHAIEGQEHKHVLPEEEISRKNARRSLVAARDLPAGHVLAAGDLVVKRPAFGLPPSALDWVLGKSLQKALAEDDFLSMDHLIG